MGKIILRLDRVMADRKMSLKELSEQVGVSNVNLSKIKTGKIGWKTRSDGLSAVGPWTERQGEI